MIVYAPRRYSGGITRWFKEIFRVHSRGEYAEFFTRGFKKEEGTHGVYPWFYSRVFVMCLVLFAVFAFVTCATSAVMMYIGLPTVIFIGSILVNIPIVVFLYEIYPKRDFSFFELCVIMIICSAISVALIDFGYFALSPANSWLSILWTAFLEETGKALPVLVALFVIKKRDPLQCLIIAASAGIGMAICEDMGYIFFSSLTGFADMGSAVTVTVIRAVTAPFGHVIWTGFIGWAFAKFRRPLINICFWGMYLLSMALHYIWDFPETSVSLITLLFSLLTGIIIFERIIRRERFKLLFPPAAGSVNSVNAPPTPNAVVSEAAAESAGISDPFDDIPVTGAPAAEKAPVEPFHVIYASVYNRAGIAATLTAMVLSVLAMLFCVVCVDGGLDTYYYQSAANFKRAVQCGHEFNTDMSRDYDVYGNNYSVTMIEGKITEAVQTVEKGEYVYYYTYTVNSFGYYTLSLLEAEISSTGEVFTCESLYDGESFIYYFNALPFVENCYFDYDFEEYVIETFSPFTFNNDNIVIMSVIAGVVFGIGAVATIAFYIIQRKQK